MHLFFKIQKSDHDEMVRAKEVSLRDPKQCLQQNSSPLHPMLKWKDVMVQECIYKKHAGRELVLQQILACGCPSGQNTNYLALGRMSPDSVILWTGWLVGNTQCLCYVSSSQNTMTSVYGEVDNSRISDLVCGHGLKKIHRYTGIEKIPRSQQLLHMVPL